MGVPSSQIIAGWAREELSSTEWIPLDDICNRALTRRKFNISQISDLIETNIEYVAEHLRDELAAGRIDGIPPEFEIDSEPRPYIRATDLSGRPLLQKLRNVLPLDFEKICAAILSKLGAQADVTEKIQDDGVDFYAIDFDFVPDGINTPQACRAAVIGQAKRYKSGNLVTETEIRAFVGGAMKVRHDLVLLKKILPLSPVVFAFWTTSDFDPNAKNYARTLGLWYLEGRSLSKYVHELALEPFVEQLLPKKDSIMTPSDN